MFRHLLANDFLFSFWNRGLSLAVSVLTSILLNRYLGPEMRGEYTYWLNIFTIVSIVMGLGLYHSYPFYKRQGHSGLIEQYGNIFALHFCVLALLAVVIAILSGDTLIGVGCFVVLMMVVNGEVGFITAVEEGRFRYVSITGISLFNLVLLAILFMLPHRSLPTMFTISIVCNVVYVIVCLRKLKLRPNLLRVSSIWLKRAVYYGGYPMLAILLQTLNYRVDVFMLKPMVAAESLGFYAFGAGIAEILWIVPGSFREVLLSRTSKDDASDAVMLSIKLSNVIMLFVMAMTGIFGKLAIRICFGEEFVPAYHTTILLFAGIPSMAWYQIIGALFNAQGKRRFFFFVMLGSVLGNIAMNAAIIPVWGIDGAALASVVSYTVCGLVFLTAYARQLGRPAYRLLWPTLADVKTVWGMLWRG